jgi:hypothetical protein
MRVRDKEETKAEADDERKRFVCELLARIARERTVNIEGVVVKRREEGEENYSELFYFIF